MTTTLPDPAMRNAVQAALNIARDNAGELTVATLPAVVAKVLNNEKFDNYPAGKIFAQALAFAPDLSKVLKETAGNFRAYAKHKDGEDLADGAMNATMLALAAGGIFGQASRDPEVIADSDEATRSYAVLRDFLILAGGVEDRTREDVEAALDEWLEILPEEVEVQGTKKTRHALQVGDVVRIAASDARPVIPAIGRIVGASPDAGLQMENTTGEHFLYRPYHGMEAMQGNQVSKGWVDVEVTKPAKESNMEAYAEQAKEMEDPQYSSTVKNTIVYAVFAMIGITLARGGHTAWKDMKEGTLNLKEGRLGDAPKKMLTTITAALPCAIMASLSEFDLVTKQFVKYGVHIKRPNAFETLGEVKRVVLDVNGPMTEHSDHLNGFGIYTERKGLALVEGEDGAPDTEGEAILQAVASLELRSQMHHMAPPIIGYAEKFGIQLADINDGITDIHKEFPTGRGISGVIEGKQRVTVGNEALFDDMPVALRERAKAHAEQGNDISYARVEDVNTGEVKWAFFSRDTGLLPRMRERVQELQKMGVEVWLNSGSATDKVMWVAKEIGLNAPQLGVNVFAEMVPQRGGDMPEADDAQLRRWHEMRARGADTGIRNKTDVIRLARFDGTRIASLGDDDNDLGMSTAVKAPMKDIHGRDVPTGIAMVMKKTGSEMMLRNADIVTEHGVDKLPYMIKASQTLNQDLKITSRASIGYVSALVGSNLFMSFLSKSPVAMAVFHELPTILFMTFSAWRASHIAGGIEKENARPLSIVEAFQEGWKQFAAMKQPAGSHVEALKHTGQDSPGSSVMP